MLEWLIESPRPWSHDLLVRQREAMAEERKAHAAKYHRVLVALAKLGDSLTYAILASAMPRAGGSYIYASRGLHPYLGFVASFSQWFGLSIVIGVIAYIIVRIAFGFRGEADQTGALATLADQRGGEGLERVGERPVAEESRPNSHRDGQQGDGPGQPERHARHPHPHQTRHRGG